MQDITVVLADDHPFILDATKEMLLRVGIDRSNIRMCTTPDEVLAAIQRSTFDVYVLDLSFSSKEKGDAFDLISTIRKKQPDACIIACTAHQEIWIINRLLGLNIDGAVCKTSDVRCVWKAIEAWQRGEKYLCPKMREIQEKCRAYRQNSFYLTPKEEQVLQEIVNGLTSKEIAMLMNSSENAIEAHRKNLFLKFGVSNVTQLTTEALRRQLATI
jgi:DNA-binding NarL/FixJ family response regulator